MKRDSNCFDPNWAIYFLRAVLQLYSITKPSANVQMRSIKDTITYGLRKVNYKDVINNKWSSVEKMCFLFLFSYLDSSRRHTGQDANSSRQEKIWARLVGKSRPSSIEQNKSFPGRGGGTSF